MVTVDNSDDGGLLQYLRRIHRLLCQQMSNDNNISSLEAAGYRDIS